mgnify:CR=1 FL=1
MKRHIPILVAFLLGSLTSGIGTYAAITNVNRARIIMDLLKDGTVANETPYASLDLATAPVADKYATAFWNVFGPDKDGMRNPILNPTNNQLAVFFLKRLGVHCKAVLEASRVPQAGTAAAATEKTTVDTETTSDLGT